MKSLRRIPISAAILFLAFSGGCATRILDPSELLHFEGPSVVSEVDIGTPADCVRLNAYGDDRESEVHRAPNAYVGMDAPDLRWRLVKIFARHYNLIYMLQVVPCDESGQSLGLFSSEQPLRLMVDSRHYVLCRAPSSIEQYAGINCGAGYLATLEFLDKLAGAKSALFRLDTGRGRLHGSFGAPDIKGLADSVASTRAINMGIEIQDASGKTLIREVESNPDARDAVAVFDN